MSRLRKRIARVEASLDRAETARHPPEDGTALYRRILDAFTPGEMERFKAVYLADEGDRLCEAAADRIGLGDRYRAYLAACRAEATRRPGPCPIPPREELRKMPADELVRLYRASLGHWADT